MGAHDGEVENSAGRHVERTPGNLAAARGLGPSLVARRSAPNADVALTLSVCQPCQTQPRPAQACAHPPCLRLGAMGDKLLEQIFNLKFTAKQLNRSAVKCEKDEKAERLKVKKGAGGSHACRCARAEPRPARPTRWALQPAGHLPAHPQRAHGAAPVPAGAAAALAARSHRACVPQPACLQP